MMPPKSKSVEEPTRSSTMPTLGGNYVVDGGNATKTIILSGDLFFPYIGSPDNPVAINNEGLENTIDGLNEFFKIRWMLIRYKDYTLSRNSNLSNPIQEISFSPQLRKLYDAVSKRMSDKVGALYDEIHLIFHDYDMDDHYFCRVNNFSSNQSDANHLAINYTINIECHEPDIGRSLFSVKQIKSSPQQTVNELVTQLNSLGFSTIFEEIEGEVVFTPSTSDDSIGSIAINIESTIESISTENDNILAAKSTVLTKLPTDIELLIGYADIGVNEFLTTFLTPDQLDSYKAGTLDISDILTDYKLLEFFNALQKVKIIANSIKGIIVSIPIQDEIYFYSNSDSYRLTEDQFDDSNRNVIQNESNFVYYTVTDGDSARVVAQKILHDQNQFNNILQLNNITENDFIDGLLTGKQIKIPVITSGISRSDDNLVYESNQDDVELFLFGSDIATGIDKKILLSGKGDLLLKSGSENAIDGITNKVTNSKGSLNIFSPNWGVTPVGDGDVPYLVRIARYITDLTNQIQSDPRVESMEIDFPKLVIEGETISTPSKIYLIGMEEHREVTV